MVIVKDLAIKLNEMQKWYEDNPNLPEKIDPMLLRRFLKCMYYDVDETKKIIELNYAMRNKHSNIFIERSPADDDTVKALAASDLLILPGLTPERYKLLFFRMADYDPSTRNSVEESKIFFMMADARFTMPDIELSMNNQLSDDDITDNDAATVAGSMTPVDNNNADDDQIADGDVQIVDISGYTVRHVARISFLILRVYMKFVQEAYPSRLRAMHIINCPTYLDKMIAIVKPFIREEVYRLIRFHADGLDSLYEQVPRDLLPEEYGGKAGKLADIKANWLRILKKKENYLSDAKHWKIVPKAGGARSRWSWF